MKEIPLTRGKVALVDDEDYEWLMQWKWRATNCASRRKKKFYATRNVTGCNGEQQRVYMHREIADRIHLAPEEWLDHRDGVGLHNWRGNLRSASPSQNSMNRQKQCGIYASDFKGVAWNQLSRRWVARIGIDRRRIHLGYFTEEIDAAEAYNRAARQYFGEFAILNPTPTPRTALI